MFSTVFSAGGKGRKGRNDDPLSLSGVAPIAPKLKEDEQHQVISFIESLCMGDKHSALEQLPVEDAWVRGCIPVLFHSLAGLPFRLSQACGRQEEEEEKEAVIRLQEEEWKQAEHVVLHWHDDNPLDWASMPVVCAALVNAAGWSEQLGVWCSWIRSCHSTTGNGTEEVIPLLLKAHQVLVERKGVEPEAYALLVCLRHQTNRCCGEENVLAYLQALARDDTKPLFCRAGASRFLGYHRSYHLHPQDIDALVEACHTPLGDIWQGKNALLWCMLYWSSSPGPPQVQRSDTWWRVWAAKSLDACCDKDNIRLHAMELLVAQTMQLERNSIAFWNGVWSFFFLAFRGAPWPETMEPGLIPRAVRALMHNLLSSLSEELYLRAEPGEASDMWKPRSDGHQMWGEGSRSEEWLGGTLAEHFDFPQAAREGMLEWIDGAVERPVGYYAPDMVGLGIEEIEWEKEGHAYGPAGDTPHLLQSLCTQDPGRIRGAFGALYGGLFHQGTRYPATVKAIPFLLAIAEHPRCLEREQTFVYLSHLAAGYTDWWFFAGHKSSEDSIGGEDCVKCALLLKTYVPRLLAVALNKEESNRVRVACSLALAAACAEDEGKDTKVEHDHRVQVMKGLLSLCEHESVDVRRGAALALAHCAIPPPQATWGSVGEEVPGVYTWVYTTIEEEEKRLAKNLEAQVDIVAQAAAVCAARWLWMTKSKETDDGTGDMKTYRLSHLASRIGRGEDVKEEQVAEFEDLVKKLEAARDEENSEVSSVEECVVLNVLLSGMWRGWKDEVIEGEENWPHCDKIADSALSKGRKVLPARLVIQALIHALEVASGVNACSSIARSMSSMLWGEVNGGWSHNQPLMLGELRESCRAMCSPIAWDALRAMSNCGGLWPGVAQNTGRMQLVGPFMLKRSLYLGGEVSVDLLKQVIEEHDAQKEEGEEGDDGAK